MVQPRRVLPGETYLLTRRCSQRAFRLHPCFKTNAIFRYCLAYAAQQSGVAVHAVCVMSNHHHLVVTDVNGRLPEFLRELHRMTAKALNAAQGQWENLWVPEPCNAVRLVTEEDVDDKIAYAVANPVAAGLVERPEAWPGVLLWGDSVTTVERPSEYFRARGTCPATLELKIEPPPSRSGKETRPADWRERVADLIAGKVAAAHRSLRKAGQRFVGRAALLASSVMKKARSYEERFGLVPTFSARRPEIREALRRAELAFRASYRLAFERWRQGSRYELFPAGTWAMVEVHGAVAGAPAASESQVTRFG